MKSKAINFFVGGKVVERAEQKPFCILVIKKSVRDYGGLHVKS